MASPVQEMKKQIISDYCRRCRSVYNGYNSSAEQLDRLLAVSGIVTDFRFAHQYKLPGQVAAPDYEMIANEYSFFSHAEFILSDMIKDPVPDDVKAAILADIPQKEQELNHDIEIIKEQNPELAGIKTESPREKMNFIMGVCYKFAPQEIDWFIHKFRSDNEDDSHAREEHHHALNNEGIDFSYMLCPEHRKLLLDMVRAQRRQEEGQITPEQKKEQLLASSVEYNLQRSNGYCSYARNLERSLADKGIITDYKFSHQYKFPDNLTPQEYEKRYLECRFYMLCSSDRVVSLQNVDPQSLKGKAKQLILSEAEERKAQMLQEIAAIKKLNPELAHIDTRGARQSVFLEHVCAQTAPEDIEYCMKMTSEEIRSGQEFIKTMRDKSIVLDYHLCPQHKSKLLELVGDFEKKRRISYAKMASEASHSKNSFLKILKAISKGHQQ